MTTTTADKGEQECREAFEKWMIGTAKIIIGSRDPYPAGLERDYWRVWQAAWNRRATAAQATPAGEGAELPEVIAFLLGEGPLDGAWFDEPRPVGAPPFWWRKPLREYATAQTAEAVRELVEGLRHAADWVNRSPHGDNCFLGDELSGDRCWCGKDSFVEATDALIAKYAPSQEGKNGG